MIVSIAPANSIRGSLRLPADKSISHRAAMIAALAEGGSLIRNYAAGRDCRSTLDCLRALGVDIETAGGDVRVRGTGGAGFAKPAAALDCGNSGTTMRLLSGILAGQEFESELTGDGSLCGRPMDRIAVPLEEMGASIKTRRGRPPLSIRGGYPLDPIDYRLPVASAQLKSCVLLAGLHTAGITSVSSPPSELRAAPSRDHTERMFRYFGAPLDEEFRETGGGWVHRVSIDGSSHLEARDFEVPGDVSASAFFISAAVGLPGSDLLIRNVGLNPTRTAFIEVLHGIGARIETLGVRSVCGEPVGDLRISEGFEGRTETIRLSGGAIANLIDELPVLAVLGTRLGGGIEVRGAGELRVKETDRISAVVGNLRRMGADVEEFPDGFFVAGSDLKGAEIDSFGDHRIAMAFAVAALFSDGETSIAGAECVDVSFPDFFNVLRGVVR